ncbi:hypothetical protein [Mangrovihabitans endophyticus]|uniref:Uncharacterized protein n=1 Tax=Mangrovihabitans endophyticus TaxID=1751298 RepID=A0A8J3FRN1_9ACTN|nr:hypothetical protein [Mangrovihabitans endophyticus]GGL13159.1 hypothetical protein GCM10012284_54800 [Mangrovihabitans endophyticus]
MTRLLFDGVVRTDYGQFDLVWGEGAGFDGDFDRFFANQVNGLVGAAAPGGLYLHFARRSGGSRLTIRRTDAAPPLPAPRYEDIVEVSVVIPAGARVGWTSWAGETSGQLDGLPGGSYRVRVSAHGRDAGHAGEFADGIVDEYLVEMWPAPVGEDAIVRTGSSDAEYWHRDVGGRR